MSKKDEFDFDDEGFFVEEGEFEEGEEGIDDEGQLEDAPEFFEFNQNPFTLNKEFGRPISNFVVRLSGGKIIIFGGPYERHLVQTFFEQLNPNSQEELEGLLDRVFFEHPPVGDVEDGDFGGEVFLEEDLFGDFDEE